MKLINNRNIYKVAFILSFIVIVFYDAWFSKILDYLNTGADRTSMLHLETESEDVYLPRVSW
jgi:hypothetical protein